MNTLRPFLAGSLALWASVVCAQYKVVGPDGTVTYTDRPPAEAKAQAVPISGIGGRVDAANLPLSLRPIVGRYPVTLYTSPGCAPCDQGRALLTQRGIPFAEKRVETDADTAALAKLTGERNLPVLTIGPQQLKGYQSNDWQGYLDAAGYPKTSELPSSYRNPASTPLTTPQPATKPVEQRKPEPTAPKAAPSDPNAPKIRF